MKNFIKIPEDPRYPNSKRTMITNKMKSACCGEFSWKEEDRIYDEDGNVIDRVVERVVPWTLCKEIYKKMALIAATELEEESF